MRLISARIRGYGRLLDAKVNLDSKVIAVVGPNEAGKTTFLKALAYLDGSEPLSPMERSRGVSSLSPGTKVVEVTFALQDGDADSVRHLNLEKAPQMMLVSRKADGGSAEVDLKPRPTKAVSSLRIALAVLEKAVERKSLHTVVARETIFADPHAEGGRDFRAELRRLVQSLQKTVDDPTGSSEVGTAELAGELAVAVMIDPKTEAFRNALNTTKVWLEREDPFAEAASALWKRTPDFLLFADQDRTLRSAYALEEIRASIPPALDNLTRMAELNLNALLEWNRVGDAARQESAIRQANNTLKDLFQRAWKQTTRFVELKIDGESLCVRIVENDNDVTVFDERSAGLRMFVALIAFLWTRDSQNPPVLLIDEAESHLHIDAQADLVNMFVSQDQAARVIYTTHSPACLPPDLGVGVRSIVPSTTNLQTSEIRNSFWDDGAGFSPLMMAMGAAAAAFTPARCVVLAEGASDMILLPSLLRNATGSEVLPYQVAPSLAQVPKDFYPALDFEGAKVAYILDGDSGGVSLRKGLVAQGVPEERIVAIPVPGVENLLQPTEYAAVVAQLVAESNVGVDVPPLPRLPSSDRVSWAQHVETWASAKNLKMPSKVAVASRILEDGKAVPSERHVTALCVVHRQIKEALGI